MATKRDVFNATYGAPFTLIFETDHQGKEYISDIIAFLPNNKEFNPADLSNKELEFIDYDKNELITVSFPKYRTTDTVLYQYKVESIKQEQKLSFRDVYTGAVVNITLGVNGEWRHVFFPETEENTNNVNKVFVKHEGKDKDGNAKVTYSLSKNFHSRRLLEGLTKDGTRYVTLETGNASELSDAMTIKDLKIEKWLPTSRISEKTILDANQGTESKEEISRKLAKLIKETSELPGIGNRMDILNSLITRVRKKKAEMMLSGGLNKENKKHALLGSIVQDFGHMAFLGNPGTLKTVFVEILYWALRAEGIITGPLVVVNGRSVVQGYVGQSEAEMRKNIQKAVSQNGMLFVDEFHTLNDVEEGRKIGGFGAAAARELVPAMENHRDKFILVVAGYPAQTRKALKDIDSGFESRFTQIYDFHDYNPQELEEQFYYLMPDEYTYTKKARDIIHKLIHDGYKDRDENFGNGRVMRNLVGEVLRNQERRLGKEKFYDYVIENADRTSNEEKAELNAYRYQINEDDLAGLKVYSPDEKPKNEGGKIGFLSKLGYQPVVKSESAKVDEFNEHAADVAVAEPSNDNAGAGSPVLMPSGQRYKLKP